MNVAVGGVGCGAQPALLSRDGTTSDPGSRFSDRQLNDTMNEHVVGGAEARVLKGDLSELQRTKRVVFLTLWAWQRETNYPVI